MEQRRASRGEDRFHHARRQHHYLSEWIVKHFSEVEIRPPGQRMPGTHDGKPGKGRELGDDFESVIVLQDTGFGDGEVENIAALKNDRSQDVRAAVAHALGDSRSKKARLILETWLEQETNLAVKLAVDKALQRLRGF